MSDIDKGACKILAHRYPDVPNIGDMTVVDWSEWVGKVDIISAGYPCQPFSAAGQRLGTKDERHLWPVIADAVAIIRPALCVFENVRGQRSLSTSVLRRRDALPQRLRDRDGGSCMRPKPCSEWCPFVRDCDSCAYRGGTDPATDTRKEADDGREA